MNATPVPYRKLTRKKRNFRGSSQLWLGLDHLLLVRSHLFVEEYRRFRFADIQSVIASAEPPRWMMRVILAICAGLSLVAAVGTSTTGGRLFAGSAAAMFAGLIAYDVIRGARCRARLLTEVSAESLEPVTRVSDYERLMRELAPAVEAEQGGRLESESAAAIDLRVTAPAFVQPPETSAGSRYLQHALYGMLLLNAIVYATAYLWRVEYALSLAGSILFAELIVTILLALRSRNFGVSGVMKTLLGLVAFMVLFDMISAVGQFGYMIYSVAEAGRQGGKTPVFWDLPRIMLLGKVSISWRVLTGLTGLTALWVGGTTARASGTKTEGSASSTPEQPQEPPQA